MRDEGNKGTLVEPISAPSSSLVSCSVARSLARSSLFGDSRLAHRPRPVVDVRQTTSLHRLQRQYGDEAKPPTMQRYVRPFPLAIGASPGLSSSYCAQPVV